MTYLTLGVLGNTLRRVGRSSALVNMPTDSGSLSEWVRPSSPKVSYAVAIGVEMQAHDRAKSCQFKLVQDGVNKCDHRPCSDVPGLSIHVEHVVLCDTQVNKTSRHLRNGFFEFDVTQVLVVTEFEVLP